MNENEWNQSTSIFSVNPGAASSEPVDRREFLGDPPRRRGEDDRLGGLEARSGLFGWW